MDTPVKKTPNRINKAVNTTMDDGLREQLEALASANRMTLSALIRWLGGRAIDNPDQFGLLPAKADKK